MDWQVIILTLGASLITGVVSLIGNIVVSKSNLKTIRLESNEKYRNEYMKKRFDTYEQFLKSFHYIEQHNDEENVLEQSYLESIWLKNYSYCSKKLNQHLKYFILSFKRKSTQGINLGIAQARDLIKKDYDEYYGIKEKIKRRG